MLTPSSEHSELLSSSSQVLACCAPICKRINEIQIYAVKVANIDRQKTEAEGQESPWNILHVFVYNAFRFK